MKIRQRVNFPDYFSPQEIRWCNQNNCYVSDVNIIFENGKAVDGYYEIKEIPKPDLDDIKSSKIESINTSKEKAFKEGLIFKGHHFDCDDRAQDRTGNRLLLLQAMPVETLEWLDFNYKPVVLTAVEFQELCAAIFERVQFIEFKTGQLLGAVESAQSIEELEAIEIDFTPSAEEILQDVDSPVFETGDDISQETTINEDKATLSNTKQSKNII